MKKIIFILTLLVSFSGFSQKIVLTPNGLVSETDNTKNYVVVDVDGKTAAEMYNNLYTYILASYKNPGVAIQSKLQDSFIYFDTHVDKLVLAKMGFTSGVYDLTYRTEVDFKEGKAKITFTDLRFTADENSNKYKFNIKGGTFDGFVVFNKKGELKDEGAKLKIELEFNEKIEILKSILSGAKKAKEEW